MASESKLQRIGAAAVRCAQPGVWALLALGMVAFLLLPLAAKKCYLDEKALLVGGAAPTVRQSGAIDACWVAHQQLQEGASLPTDFAGLVSAATAAIAPFDSGLKFHHHSFLGSMSFDKCNIRSRAINSNDSSTHHCHTLHTVVRTPLGDGSEGYVLMLPLNTSSSAAAALAAAIGMAVAGHLQRSRWLAKDAVLLFADTAACSVEDSAEGWMAAYNSDLDLFAFPRAGLLQQALVLEVAGPAPTAGSAGIAGSDAASSAEVSVHGSDGLLPNLDLYYLIKRNLELHTTLPVGLRAAAQPLPPYLHHGVAALAHTVSAAGMASPPVAQRYASELQTLAAFAGQLASGQPTGAHAAFLARQVDAATLSLRFAAAAEPAPSSRSASSMSSPKARQRAQMAAQNALVAAEMVLRTFNNLQERLHHSTALYVLVSPNRFASIAVYLAPPACLLLAALAQLVVASRAAAASATGGGAHLAAWHSAWRRVAVAHSVAMAGGAAAAWAAHGSAKLGAGLIPLGWQLLLAAATGLVAAEGPAALLAALKPDSRFDACQSGSSSEATPSEFQVQLCARAAGLSVAVLRGAHLLMGQWVHCFISLLLIVPLYALRPAQSGSTSPVTRAVVLLGYVMGAWTISCHSGTAWLLSMLTPHLLMAANECLQT